MCPKIAGIVVVSFHLQILFYFIFLHFFSEDKDDKPAVFVKDSENGAYNYVKVILENLYS
jgi:hypothetical protein